MDALAKYPVQFADLPLVELTSKPTPPIEHRVIIRKGQSMGKTTMCLGEFSELKRRRRLARTLNLDSAQTLRFLQTGAPDIGDHIPYPPRLAGMSPLFSAPYGVGKNVTGRGHDYESTGDAVLEYMKQAPRPDGPVFVDISYADVELRMAALFCAEAYRHAPVMVGHDSTWDLERIRDKLLGPPEQLQLLCEGPISLLTGFKKLKNKYAMLAR